MQWNVNMLIDLFYSCVSVLCLTAYKKRKEAEYKEKEPVRRALHDGHLTDEEEDMVEEDEETEVLIKEEIVEVDWSGSM